MGMRHACWGKHTKHCGRYVRRSRTSHGLRAASDCSARPYVDPGQDTHTHTTTQDKEQGQRREQTFDQIRNFEFRKFKVWLKFTIEREAARSSREAARFRTSLQNYVFVFDKKKNTMTCASARFQRMSRHKKRTIEEPPGHHKAPMYTNLQRANRTLSSKKPAPILLQDT